MPIQPPDCTSQIFRGRNLPCKSYSPHPTVLYKNSWFRFCTSIDTMIRDPTQISFCRLRVSSWGNSSRRRVFSQKKVERLEFLGRRPKIIPCIDIMVIMSIARVDETLLSSGATHEVDRGDRIFEFFPTHALSRFWRAMCFSLFSINLINAE